MIKIYRVTLPLLLALFILSCGEDESPLPTPTVDFFADPEVVEVGVPVMFDNLTINAASYQWDFGDGQTSTETSPTITFETAGTFTVKLTAVTQDNQMVEVAKDIKVKVRVFAGYFLNLFPFTNDGEDWDEDEEDSTKYADILLLLAPQDPANTDFYQDGIYFNVNETPFSSAGNGMTLTDETWNLVLFDYDGHPDSVSTAPPSDYSVMTGVSFRPLAVDEVMNDDGDGGFMSLFFRDNVTDQVVDIDLFFELQDP